MNLPDVFIRQMKEYFQRHSMTDEVAFFDALDEPSQRGLRFNRIKVCPQEDKKILEFLGEEVRRVPWSDSGYYLSKKITGNHPFYLAGAYYIQEPSAMLPAEMLDIEPGDKVLDLCAAPGGKATRIAEKLDGQGILVANEISRSRSSSLLYNIERMGIINTLIFCETPEKLATVFGSYFDKILIDAPCSGEGMFRRDPAAITSWLKYGPGSTSKIQMQILDSADQLLKAGGHMVYSTCTFSEAENEKIIADFISAHPAYEIIDHPELRGITSSVDILGQKGAVRIWPHLHNGEGHFCVHLKKRKSAEEKRISIQTFFKSQNQPNHNQYNEMANFFNSVYVPEYLANFIKCKKSIHIHNGHVKILPDGFYPFHAVKCVKDGFYLGELKAMGSSCRFIPSHALALSSSTDMIKLGCMIKLSYSDDRVIKYLKGETLQLTTQETYNLIDKGFVMISMNKYPLGWGKIQGTTVKNIYPKAWRIK